MASTSGGNIEEAHLPRLLLSPHRRRSGVILLACGSFNPPTFMHLRMFELARDHLHRKTNYRVVEGVISVVNDAYKKKDLASAEHRLAMVRLALENSKWIRVDEWEARQTQYCPTVNVLRHIRAVTRTHLYATADPHSFSIEEKERARAGPPVPLKRQKTDGAFTHSSTESSGVSSTVSDHQPPAAPVVPKSASIDTGTAAPACHSTQDAQALRVMLLCGSDLLQSFEEPDLWDAADMEEIVRDFGIVVVTRSGYDPRKVVYESDVLTRHENNIHHVTEWIANDVSSTKIRRALKRSESVRYLVADRVLDYIYQHKLYGCAQRHIDVLTSASALLDSARDAMPADPDEGEEPHCSYHPQYQLLRKSVDDSDYDNLAPCPCPLTSSASAPNTAAIQLLRYPYFVSTPAATAPNIRPPSISQADKAFSLDLTGLERASAAKPTAFPTDLEAALRVTKSDGYRNSGRSTTIKSALKSPPTTSAARQRAVSYHSDLSRSSSPRSRALPYSRTIDAADSLREGQEGTAFGSVSAQQRSLSNLVDVQLPSSRERNGTPRADSLKSGPTATVPKNGDRGVVTEEEEITWHYNPELTKSMPNLRLQRQTPPRHVRILDKGICFTPEDRQQDQRREEGLDEPSSNIADNLVVKVKQLKLTISPETTV